MIERTMEYLVNALWQLPLLALGAWWMLRAVRVGPVAQHRVWVAVLGLGVLLPLARVGPRASVAVMPARTVAGSLEMPVRVSGPVVETGWARDVLRRRSVRVSATTAEWLAGMYGVVGVLGLLRIVRGWRAARRLVREAETMADEPMQSLLEECGRRMGVESGQVVVSGEVSSPAVVGDVLLLPEGFGDYGHEEMRAALLHEMAHIRRRDYAANVWCEVAAVPLVWHPVMHAVQSRIRSTREMVCDAMAAEQMGSAVQYARALAGLAARTIEGGLGEAQLRVGLFTNNNLEERVMRLTERKQAVAVRAKVVRVMSGAAGMAAVVALAASVHLTPAMAQEAAATKQATSQGQSNAAAAPAETGQAKTPEEGVETGVVAPVVEGVSGSVDASMTGTGTGQGMASMAGQTGGTGASRSAAAGMAKGVDAYVEPKHGYRIHTWTAADGEPFQMMNKEKAEPTTEQRKRYEEEFALQMEKARAQMEKARAQMDSPEFKEEMAKLNSPEFKETMATQMQEMKKQMAEAKINGKQAQKQMAEAQRMMKSPAMQKQMADLRSGKMQAELEAQMAAMRAQVDATVNGEMQKARLKETQEQLDEARKELDEARKELEAERSKQKP